MGSFSYHVGQRIKKYRKSRGYTIEQFSAMINKSKATVSKYENGTITIDVETLYDIARALDIDLKCFIDYQPPVFHAQSVLPKNFYFNQPRAYMYYYDGRVRQLVRSLLCFSPAASGDGIDVMLYLGVDDFREPDRCQHLFTGEMKPYDTITHMVLTNQINEAEKMYICMLNPMHNRTPAVGLLSGIGSTPVLCSHRPENPDLQGAAGGKRPVALQHQAGQGRLSPAEVLQHAGGKPSRFPVFAVNQKMSSPGVTPGA